MINKEVRRYLKICTRKEFDYLIYESKLTPNETKAIQSVILEEKTLDESADILNCSSRTVSKLLSAAYQKIGKVKLN